MFLTGTFKKAPPQNQLPDEGQSTGLLAGSQEGLPDYGSRIAAVEAKLAEYKKEIAAVEAEAANYESQMTRMETQP